MFGFPEVFSGWFCKAFGCFGCAKDPPPRSYSPWCTCVRLPRSVLVGGASMATRCLSVSRQRKRTFCVGGACAHAYIARFVETGRRGPDRRVRQAWALPGRGPARTGHGHPGEGGHGHPRKDWPPRPRPACETGLGLTGRGPARARPPGERTATRHPGEGRPPGPAQARRGGGTAAAPS